MKEKLRKINDFKWELPISVKKQMNVPGIVYGSDKILDNIETRMKNDE